ncbi:MAG: NAD(P)/FAD-dependent oxidoreductase [Oscillospiraceae bacterium]|nr:NAD(P)/FAD-dependent oxidoreductase [Oscillospiraceae bacterium]
MRKLMSKKIAIIGGGAAGMMAAVQAEADVTLFEKNPMLGKKLAITGKGRCNITNNCTVDEFLTNIPVNPKFLYAALNAFSPADTMAFFEKLGVPLKTERGNRVFPVSDKAADVVNALRKAIKCPIVQNTVTEICIENGQVTGLKTGNKFYAYDAVIVCTGGLSYPLTGSTGDGYKFAQAAGLNVTPLKPSLVPIEVEEKWCGDLQGLSLKNVAIKIISDKVIYSDFGELLFTHFGLSGPVILSASAYMREVKDYKIQIDLKPALDEKTLDNRLLSDFTKNINKNFSNALNDLLPQKMIPVIISLSGIDPYKKVNLITQEERSKLLKLIKSLTLKLKCFRPIEEAIITSGGVDCRELDPKMMQSKKVRGLYFAGEVIDVDGYTGGFNLQIAFSTAVLASRGAIQ